MLKHSDRITKLTEAQKIRILSNVGNISGKDMKNLGIPSIAIGNMKDYERNTYPHTTSISHAWNTELWSDVASVKVKKMAECGINFAIAPGSKIKLSPYRKEATEDPYLASLISGAYMKSASALGMESGAAGYYLTEADVEWMDANPNQRILQEYVVRPYTKANLLASTSSMITDSRIPSEAYQDTCAYLQRVVVDYTEFLICENATEENTVSLISRGIICLHASENALNSALTRYKQLYKLFEEGKNVSFLQIEEELKNGTAISREALDQALDQALEFLFRCNKRLKLGSLTEAEENELSLKATLESTVLLKNKNAVLPLAKNKSVLIIDGFFSAEEDGAFAAQCQAQLEEAGIYARTERIQLFADTNLQYRVDHLTPMCRNFDTTILLLGSGAQMEKQIHKTEKLTLPPVQLSLADQVSKYGNNIVTVIFSEHSTDIEFTRLSDAVLFAPLPVKHSATALTEILLGNYNPSGRLAYTLYAGSETSLKKGAAYLHQFRMKSGPFIGYRYYDTAELRVGYPFGHGLSYTKFIYSNLSVSDDTISFSVQNAGNVAGYEVAQVYVGMKNSAIIRPKKELCGFAKIHLLPLEEKRITIKVDYPQTFNNGLFVVEKGEYQVSVGSSVSDIRLTATCMAGDVELESKGERLSDYLQSQSNILNNNYTLEANYGVMKNGITNIITGAVSLALAITLTVFNITMNLNSLVLGIISGILALCSILLFAIETVQRNRAHAENIKNIAEANQEYFEDAEQIPVLSADKMFEEQFDTVAEAPIFFEQVSSSSEEEIDYSKYIDDKFRITDAVEEFKVFAAERGYKMDLGVVENLFSSLLVSKLLICNGLSANEFNSFVLLLSEYFGCSVCIDNLLQTSDASDEETRSMFFENDTEEVSKKKNLCKALSNAVNLTEKMHFAAIDELNSLNATEWLSPMMRYLRSAKKKKNEIVIVDETGKKWGYVIDHNFWVVVRLSDDQTVDMLPIEIVKTAAVINVSYTKCQVAEDHMASHGFTSYQVDYMLSQAVAHHDVPEELWKKIDKFEKYVQDYSDYTIGNKLWLDLEKQMAVLQECNMELDDATDAALATKILPSASVALRGKLTKEDRTVLQEIEFIFGEDHMQYARAFILSLIVKEKAPKSEVMEPVAEEVAQEELVVEEVEIEEIVAEEAEVEEVEVEEVEEEVEEVEDEEDEVEEVEDEEAEDEEAEDEEDEDEEAKVEEPEKKTDENSFFGMGDFL